MSELLKRLLSGCGLRNEVAGDGDPGAGGSGEGGEATVQPDADDPAKQREAETKLDAGMAGAIAETLKVDGVEKPAEAAAGGDKKTEAKTAAAPSPEEKAKREAEAKAKQEADTKAKAEADAKAKEEQEKKDLDAIKGKTAKDFALTPEEKKALHEKSRQRFHELHTYAKTQEDIAKQAMAGMHKLSAQVKMANDLVAAIEEHQCSPEDLTALLQYNKAVRTGDYKTALAYLDATREAILTEMGEEGPGVDLLKPYPDLAAKVEAGEMTREAALEVVRARTSAKRQEELANERKIQQEQQQATRQQYETVMTQIEGWCAKKAREDIDYKAKEAKILAKIPDLVRRYPVSQLLVVIEDLYSGIEIVKPTGTTVDQPLRSSGGKRGGAAEPGSMEEAIAGSLGIALK